jgi:hypothetical protein
MKLPFGTYRRRQPADCPRSYLRWLVTRDWISNRLRDEVDQALAPDNCSCLGPRWFYLQRPSQLRTVPQLNSEPTLFAKDSR